VLRKAQILRFEGWYEQKPTDSPRDPQGNKVALFSNDPIHTNPDGRDNVGYTGDDSALFAYTRH